VLQTSSPSYILMASLDAARQQVQQQADNNNYNNNDTTAESFVARGLRLATAARAQLAQLPPLRVLDGANPDPYPNPYPDPNSNSNHRPAGAAASAARAGRC
jgi:arginine/lysine/ornithine decarboxylase